jgi:hypothetical protein
VPPGVTQAGEPEFQTLNKTNARDLSSFGNLPEESAPNAFQPCHFKNFYNEIEFEMPDSHISEGNFFGLTNKLMEQRSSEFNNLMYR